MRNYVGERWIKSSSKRAEDISIAAVALPPAILASAIGSFLIYLECPTEPVWFGQVRVGENGRLIKMLKIRTMDRIDYSDRSTGPADVRATRIGIFLRWLGIDELPQLVNVLKGDMSIVGPRPILPAQVGLFRDGLSRSEYSDWVHAYQAGRPGLVSHYALEARQRAQPISFEAAMYRRAELDVHYYETASHEIDRRLILGAIAAEAAIATTI